MTTKEADRLAVLDLIHQYAEAVDDKDSVKMSMLFSDNCEFRAIQGSKGIARNRSEIVAISTRIFSIFEATSHHVSNTRLVFETDDRVRGLTYLYAWHRFIEDQPDGFLWGRYHDIFERQENKWVFVERTLRVTAQDNFPMRWVEPLRGSLDS